MQPSPFCYASGEEEDVSEVTDGGKAGFRGVGGTTYNGA